MKHTIFSLIFVIVVSSSNWNISKVYQAYPLKGFSLDGAVIVIILCLIAFFFLIRSIYIRSRCCISKGIQIRWSVRFIYFLPCLLLLPMLVSSGLSYSDTDSEGLNYIYRRGYGGKFSIYALFVAIITVILYRFNADLETKSTVSLVNK